MKERGDAKGAEVTGSVGGKSNEEWAEVTCSVKGSGNAVRAECCSVTGSDDAE